jgi:hypothetical protein
MTAAVKRRICGGFSAVDRVGRLSNAALLPSTLQATDVTEFGSGTSKTAHDSHSSQAFVLEREGRKRVMLQKQFCRRNGTNANLASRLFILARPLESTDLATLKSFDIPKTVISRTTEKTENTENR